MSRITKGLQGALRHSKLRAIHDALEFYAQLDCKAEVPAEASPAMPALNYVKELMQAEGVMTTYEVMNSDQASTRESGDKA